MPLTQRWLAVLVLVALGASGLGCQRPYVCPEEKDRSQLDQWKALGVPAAEPGVVVCEASEQNFSAAIPSPPGGVEVVKSLETKWKAEGWSDSPLKGYVPRTDEKSATRRFEKCGEPQNPLGEKFVDCEGALSVEVNPLPSNLIGKPFLLWLDHRPTLKSHHKLTGTTP
jgi:hypothetical protein